MLRFRKLQAANETAKVGALALVKALSFDCFTINSGWTLGWSQHNKEFKFEARTDNCVFDLICRWGWTNKENGLLVVKTLDHYLHSSETVLAVLICVERKSEREWNRLRCSVKPLMVRPCWKRAPLLMTSGFDTFLTLALPWLCF